MDTQYFLASVEIYIHHLLTTQKTTQTLPYGNKCVAIVMKISDDMCSFMTCRSLLLIACVLIIIVTGILQLSLCCNDAYLLLISNPVYMSRYFQVRIAMTTPFKIVV